MRVRTTIGAVGAVLAFVGCNTGAHSSSKSRDRTAAGASAPTAAATSATPGGATPGGATPARPASSSTTTARLRPTDRGVQVGLRLLRAEATAAEAVSGWTAEGLTPQQAKDVLARLPLTPAFPAGRNQSTIVDGWRTQTDITVIVPSTPAPAAGYPVIVFLHGLGGNSGHVAGTAQHFPQAISVAPTAQLPPAGLTFEDDAPIPLQSSFPHWWVYRDHGFATRALDWVRERYPVDTNRIFLVGASMGGYGTWNVGLRLHDRFAGLVLAAAGISRKEFGTGRDAVTRSLLENVAMVPVFFAHGDQDQVIPVRFSQMCDADLTGLKLAHIYREVAGAGHSNDAFVGNAALTTELKTWAGARVRNPAPTTVKHRAIAGDHPGAYWVELTGGAGTIQASISGSTVTVTTTGAQGARVYLDPRLIDVTAPVTVRLNGATLFQGVPQPSLAAVARSFERTRDPQLTYCYVVGQ